MKDMGGWRCLDIRYWAAERRGISKELNILHRDGPSFSAGPVFNRLLSAAVFGREHRHREERGAGFLN